MKLPSILDSDGRRAWSFLAVLGGCFTMTAFAAFGVWNVRNSPGLSFWLALAAHAQIALGLGVFGAQFVKRNIKATRDGLEISDTEVTTTTTTKVEGLGNA